MTKKIMCGSIALALVLSFVGCGGSESKSSISSNSSTNSSKAKGIFKVSPTSSGMKIEWARTGKAIYGSYTQLEIKNDIKTYRIATTNSNGKITIYCTENYKESDNTKYTCKPDNVTYSYPLRLTTDKANIVQERAGVKPSSKVVTLPQASLLINSLTK